MARAQLEGEPPDLTISTGLRSVPVVRELRRRSGGRNPLRASRLPAHFAPTLRPRGCRRRNIRCRMRRTSCASPSRSRPTSSAKVSNADLRFLDDLPRPRRLFLIGGPTLYWHLPKRESRCRSDTCSTQRATDGGSILAVASPRTPDRFAVRSRERVSKSRLSRICSRPAKGPPAYPALIEAADEIFVTADSVAMTADAVMTGKPVGLVPIAKSPLGRAVMAALGPATARRAALPARPALLLGGPR